MKFCWDVNTSGMLGTVREHSALPTQPDVPRAGRETLNGKTPRGLVDWNFDRQAA